MEQSNLFSNLGGGRDSRGQVGIGTLIVFVAMVLVAGTAAGVLIQTSGFLQEDASEAGQESVDQVDGRLQVFGVYGNVTGQYDDSKEKDGSDALANGTLNTVRITVGLAPAASPVNMSTVVIYWSGPEATTALEYGGSEQYAPGRSVGDGFSTSDLSPAPGGDDGASDDGPHQTFHTYSYNSDSHRVVTTDGQRLSIYINAALVESETAEDRRSEELAPLRDGEEVELIIETGSGATTQLSITLPETLDDDSVIEL